MKTKVHVSGNPWTDFGGKKKFYKDKELTSEERDCAEPKVLSDVNSIISALRRDNGIRVTVYLYSEFTPCRICQGKINQWLDNYPRVELVIVAHELFTFGGFKSTWHYDKCEGYYYYALGAHNKHKDPKYKPPLLSSTPVTSNVSFASLAAAAAKK